MTKAEAKAQKFGMTPLEYMLTVMNDSESDTGRRDRMAVAAAPYVHAKVVEFSRKARRRRGRLRRQRVHRLVFSPSQMRRSWLLAQLN